ncbi:MAG: molybdenum ABC transporter ATP-binding protein [Paracoccaceae bacterium]
MTCLDLSICLQHADFTMTVREVLPVSGVTAIFGPSGAGKTTLLRAIAGFDRAEGRIAFAGEVWQDAARFVPPHRRRIASVFQQPRLFTHLDVSGNLAYAARRSGQTDAVTAMAARFGVTPLMDRRIHGLSGGEAQRVALARALLTNPRLILMDEPLSALDHVGRTEILPYIESLRDEAKVPVIYVSHSLSEVTRLATNVLALASGRVLRFGLAGDVLSDPAAAAAFGAEETGCLISATVRGMTGDGLCELVFSGGTILTPERMGDSGDRVRLFVRARDVMLARHRPEGLSALNILPTRVISVATAGSASAEVRLDCSGTALSARITQRSAMALGLAPGVDCFAILKTVTLARD